MNLVHRVLRDQLSDEFKAIRLDTEAEYTKVLEFVSRFQPSLVTRVRLHLKDNAIFEEYGVQQEVDKAMRAKVWLKSGGYIVVNQTEALVAIDVNTGKFVGKSNRLEDTIVRTNMDAVYMRLCDRCVCGIWEESLLSISSTWKSERAVSG